MSNRVETIAAELWHEVRDHQQGARRVSDDAEAAQVRSRVRALAAEAGIKVRTARLNEDVLAARLDADVWTEDRMTMRAKFAVPPPAHTRTSNR